MAESLKWETIERRNGVPVTERAKVPGGWLVRYGKVVLDGGHGGLTFLPDPEHTWDVEVLG